MLSPTHSTTSLPSPPVAAPQRAHWIAVDSDGCVLNSMEPKHRECFAPALVEVWNLHAIATVAVQGFLRLNLNSEHRGTNRFKALNLFWSWLQAKAPSGFTQNSLPPLDRFNRWVRCNQTLTAATLMIERSRYPDDMGLALALHWSQRVDELARRLPPIQPFTETRTALEQAQGAGMLYVVTSAPEDVIKAEWRTSDLSAFVTEFYAQEAGSKASILSKLAAAHGATRGLMIGDSPGDAEAAEAAGVPFYPILPGAESESWIIFRQDVLPAFLSDRYSAADARRWTDRFLARLSLNHVEPL